MAATGDPRRGRRRRNDSPAKPNIAACQSPPSAAICTPPALPPAVSDEVGRRGLPEIAQRQSRYRPTGPRQARAWPGSASCRVRSAARSSENSPTFGRQVEFLRQQSHAARRRRPASRPGSAASAPARAPRPSGWCGRRTAARSTSSSLKKPANCSNSPVSRIEAGDQRLRSLPPLLELRIVKPEPGCEIRPAIGPALAQQCRDIEAAPDVPAGHDIGVGVVVDHVRGTRPVR